MLEWNKMRMKITSGGKEILRKAKLIAVVGEMLNERKKKRKIPKISLKAAAHLYF